MSSSWTLLSRPQLTTIFTDNWGILAHEGVHYFVRCEEEVVVLSTVISLLRKPSGRKFSVKVKLRSMGS